MNTSHIKAYAPKARTDFIAAITKQAAKYGITEASIEPVEIKGDVALISGRPFPKSIVTPRTALIDTIKQKGFTVVMEQVAYSWFNRLCAIRYMELHDYLGHGRRVLSDAQGSANAAGGRTPGAASLQTSSYQILDECLDIDLSGLDTEKVRQLKLDGTKDEQLYRELLLAQCHALHQAMPFLFEKVDDQTELLLPENLTKTDSLIKALVSAIPEQDWQSIEIIGWLYQFYISEKKDQVIGKVVKSEDIPAATQLFTPNWIVKYMVQNSLGAQWLATYPDSPLKAQMDYYIEPAEQTDEVNAQLKAITPETLNPEELTLIDPASGSGHILVEAYDLFKAIYLERGYRQRDIAQLILEKNLFGLDIDERAAQLTGFALMMKGRADDRRLFERGVKLNVMALVDNAGFDAAGLTQGMDLLDYGLQRGDLTELKELFEHATTFGSLIQVPEELAVKLPALKQLSEATSQDLFVSEALKHLAPLVKQAELLVAQYDSVVANPPYMGSKFYNSNLKGFVNLVYKAGKADLYAAFTLRNIGLTKDYGRVGMITIPNWMFLSSFEALRRIVFRIAPISSLVHNGRGVWGSDFGSCSYILRPSSPQALSGCFLRLFEKHVSVASNEELRRRFYANARFNVSNTEFRKIAGSPLAYSMSKRLRATFDNYKPVSSVVQIKHGMTTGNTDRFIRRWTEIASKQMCTDARSQDKAATSGKKWFPIAKGGDFRKWFGNNDCVINYENRASEMREAFSAGNLPGFRHDNSHLFFQPLLVGSGITAGAISFRYVPLGYVVDVNLRAIYSAPEDAAEDCRKVLGFLGSSLVSGLTQLLNPTLATNIGDIERLPVNLDGQDLQIVEEVIAQSMADWNAYERSWDFQFLPILTSSTSSTATLESSYTAWITQNRDTIAEMKRLEEESNRLFIDAYDLADELTPDVPIEQITLTVNPAYRYGRKLSEDDQWTRFREDSMEELVSYAIGCMMGRYSLDEPGLIYAHSGNEGFDALLDDGRYTTFPADDDGIIPLTQLEWFDDDAANRLVEFINQAWDSQHLEANLNFLADNLSPKKGEGSRDTLRRYLSNQFFKDHLKTYKKRPIYWLFSSGKEKAFQCLVYLHRYNESTLARMRTEYVIPLTAKLSGHVAKLEKDKDASASTAEIKKLEKQITQLHKQQAELSTFDEKLRHHADQRITLDLDDGVKVNYGKFGDLLVDVKAVHGKVAT